MEAILVKTIFNPADNIIIANSNSVFPVFTQLL